MIRRHRGKEEYNEDKFEDNDAPREIQRDLISGDDLLRLHYCSQSTGRGIIDHGMPMTMKRLMALHFVKEVPNGYLVTDQGKAYLKLKKNNLE